MPSWRDALTATGDGVDLLIEVMPNAKTPGFPTGYNPWRNRIQARLAAPPTAGKANDELRNAIAFFLDASLRDVTILEGATSRLKRIHVRGALLAEAHRRIEDVLA